MNAGQEKIVAVTQIAFYTRNDRTAVRVADFLSNDAHRISAFAA